VTRFFFNALELSIEDRTELVVLLIESLDSETEAGVEEACG